MSLECTRLCTGKQHVSFLKLPRMNPNSSRQYEGAERAEVYAKYRPKTPQVVIDKIIAYLKDEYDGELALAVDAGCGSGQSTVGLAPHFGKVFAMDISEAQINQAKSKPHPSNIDFRQGPAERIPLEDGSVQLVNVSQAAHYFSLSAFFQEVERILCLNGIVAISAYVNFNFDGHQEDEAKAMSAAFEQFYLEKLAPYSVAELGMVEREYSDIIMPFKESVREEISVEVTITLTEYGNFIRSWCLFQNYCQVHGDIAGQEILKELQDRFCRVLRTDLPPEEVMLKTKRTYILLMGRKI